MGNKSYKQFHYFFQEELKPEIPEDRSIIIGKTAIIWFHLTIL